jgi:hypothetical protein
MSPKLKDLFERVVWTAVQAFAGVFVALEITGSVDWETVFYAAGVAALVAAAKAVVAFQFGDPNSAALPDHSE